jgi:hypothetical protein
MPYCFYFVDLWSNLGLARKPLFQITENPNSKTWQQVILFTVRPDWQLKGKKIWKNKNAFTKEFGRRKKKKKCGCMQLSWLWQLCILQYMFDLLYIVVVIMTHGFVIFCPIFDGASKFTAPDFHLLFIYLIIFL